MGNSSSTPQGLWKRLFHKSSTWDCGLDSEHLIVKYEELRFTQKPTGLLSQQLGIHLQSTAVLIFCYSFAKGLRSLSSGIHFQRTAVLVQWYSFAKNCSPCLVPLVCKGTAVLVSTYCPSKIKMDWVLAKKWRTTPQGLWKWLFHKFSTWDCGLDRKHPIVSYEKLLFTHKQIKTDCRPSKVWGTVVLWRLVEKAVPQISTCDCGLDSKDLFVNYEEPLFLVGIQDCCPSKTKMDCCPGLLSSHSWWKMPRH